MKHATLLHPLTQKVLNRTVNAENAEYMNPSGNPVYICSECGEPVILVKEFTRNDGTVVSAFFRHRSGAPDCELKHDLVLSGSFSSSAKQAIARYQSIKLFKTKFIKMLGASSYLSSDAQAAFLGTKPMLVSNSYEKRFNFF